MVSFVDVYFFGHFFFVILGMDESGYAYTKFAQEFINCIGFYWVMFKYAHPETLKLPDFKRVLKKFGTFLYNSSTQIASFYGE